MGENGCADEAGPEELLNKIHEAESLLQTADLCFHDVEGIGKLKNKLKAELRFLNDLRNLSGSDLKRYLDTSNVVHFRGLIDVAKKHFFCSAFYKNFSGPVSEAAKREVDLVVDGGATWVKVISRNVRGLAMDFVGASGNSNRSVIEQAQDYLKMAQNHLYLFKPPKIIFEFVSGVPDMLARKLESFGINVCGNEVSINELVRLPADFASDDEYNYRRMDSVCMESKCFEAENCSVDTVNLDVTAVFVLISSLTHDNGAVCNYASRLLNSQAALERKKPSLPVLLKAIKDKRLIICRTAYNSVQSILGTVAGPEEKLRAQKLFENVEIVEDKLSERAFGLKLSDKINERSKIIFGSGDYYKAVTVTANRHFVYAAAHQGVRFAVILHESRALSEQKRISSQS